MSKPLPPPPRSRARHRIRIVVCLAATTATLLGISGSQPVDSAAAVPAPATPAPNPEFAHRCGLDLAMVLDLSGSIDAGEFAAMRTAASGFVEALAGTPSAVALFTFATSSPAAGGPQNGPFPLTSLAAGDAAEIADRIDRFTKPGDEGQFTNWHAAFEAVVATGEHYDGVVFLSDGNANRPLDEPLAAAIAAANAVKALGTRIVGVGIGDDLEPGNLAAVSGPVEGHDWYRTEFDTLGTTLHDLAAELCGGTVTVRKRIRVGSGGAGWRFAAGPGALPAAGVTDDDGLLTFAFSDLPDGGTQVTLSEIPTRPGWALQSIDCTVGGDPLTLTPVALGARFALQPGDIVRCDVTNVDAPGAPDRPAEPAFTG